MTTSNHILTGTLIALTVKEPALAVPLALASHFIIDALPHWGDPDMSKSPRKRFYSYAKVELLGITGIILLLLTGVYGWNLVLLCSIVAILPDIEWPIRYLAYARLGERPPQTVTAKWHKKIQRFERPWGGYIEATYFFVGYMILLGITR